MYYYKWLAAKDLKYKTYVKTELVGYMDILKRSFINDF